MCQRGMACQSLKYDSKWFIGKFSRNPFSAFLLETITYSRDCRARKISLWYENMSTFSEEARIKILMVIRWLWKRDHDHSDSECCELKKARRSSSGDRYIYGRIQVREFFLRKKFVSRDEVVRCEKFLKVTIQGPENDRHATCWKNRDIFEDKFKNSSRSETSSDDEDMGAWIIFTRDISIRHEKLRIQDLSDDFRFSDWKIPSGWFESEKNSFCKVCYESVRQSRYRVRFMEKDWFTKDPSRDRRGKWNISSFWKNDIDLFSGKNPKRFKKSPKDKYRLS